MNAIHGRVYVISNSVNAKKYVGKTTRPLDKRFLEHLSCFGKCRAIESAIRKYGVDAFSIEELATADSHKELNRLEQHWIARLNTIAPAGYNLSGGGDGAGVMHEQTKAIIRANARRPEHMARFQKMRTDPDVRQRQAQSAKERWRDPQFRERVSQGIMVALNDPEVRAKRSAAIKAAYAKPEVKKKHAAVMAEIHARPEVQQKRAASISRAWSKPGERERRGAAISAGWKKRTQPRKQAVLSDQERQRRRDLMLKRWESPEFRAKIAARMADREMISKRNAAISAGKQKRKLLKC